MQLAPQLFHFLLTLVLARPKGHVLRRQERYAVIQYPYPFITFFEFAIEFGPQSFTLLPCRHQTLLQNYCGMFVIR